MPLITLAYLAFACGLLAGFSGIAWLAVATGIAGVIAAALKRDARLAGLSLVIISAASLAILSAVPGRRLTRTEIISAREQSDATMLGHMRQRASRSIERVFTKDAPMAKALLIADQHEISPEMRDRYARAGIIHMLSISGLHVAIIAGAVLLFFQLARLPPTAASLGSLVVMAIYVVIIGAPPPAVRSAGMLAVGTASRLWQRPTSPWAAWAIGAFIPLVQPRVVLDLGYQLSVAGIAGLIASGALARRLLDPHLSGFQLRIGRDLLTSSIASVISAPLVMWYFGRLSVIAPIANLVAGPVITILQPTLFLALALAPVLPVARFLASAAHPLLRAFDGVAITASSIPGSSLQIAPTFMAVVAGGIVVSALIVAALSRYPARPLIIAVGASALIAWAPAIHLPYSGNVELHVLDVGQGDAILLRTNKGGWVLFDAGRIWKTGDAGRSTVIPYVQRRGGALESFVLSHAHSDHIGGASSVFVALHPKTFWDAAFAQGSEVYDKALRTARDAHVEWRRVHPGDELDVDDVAIEFLAPDSAWTASLDDPNSASTIALVHYGSVRILMVGDAEAPEEEWLLDHARNELHADILKIGHHGSSTSSTEAFLAAVHPSTAVISVGADNTYGHPSADVLAALQRVGARVVRTDKVGTIVLRTDGRHITMEAEGKHWDISPVSPGY
ncbi:MAG TPA: DNA internalization-related competence protein ComEC/Rec2 [Gemmatimonadaceae bacterium]|nr:DNA internalization-related competence protein ComEC/Rec2 [Gemmatimonadaceae bacterium]